MNQSIPAEFHGTSLSIIDHAGQKWLTAEEVGRCLGYDPSNARKGVIKLFERHGDEFTEQDTFVVKLTSNARGNPTTRIFSATGCIKVGFFAQTNRAREFRTWASQALARQQTEQNSTVLIVARENGQLRDMVAARDQIITAKDQVIMSLQDRLIGSQGRQIRLVVQMANIQKRQRDKEIIQIIEVMEAEGKPRDEIAKATGKDFNYIRQRIFIARNEGRLPKIEGANHA